MLAWRGLLMKVYVGLERLVDEGVILVVGRVNEIVKAASNSQPRLSFWE